MLIFVTFVGGLHTPKIKPNERNHTLSSYVILSRSIEQIADTALLVSTATIQPQSILKDLKGAVKVN